MSRGVAQASPNIKVRVYKWAINLQNFESLFFTTQIMMN